MNKIKMFDFAIEHAPIMEQLEAAAVQVIRSGQFILGPTVEDFEKSCAHYLGVKHAVGVSSGTDALIMALRALDIGPGDEVICPSFSFFATSEAISRVCARPVYVDINADDFTIDTKQIESAITILTKAIMPVHLFGQSAEMSHIGYLAKKHNLVVIEDAAQAIGATYGDLGQPVGGHGDIGCFSFFPTKNLGGFGESGLVSTNSDTVAVKLKALRNHGCSERYYHDILGGNFRMDAIQAALLQVKLSVLANQEKARVSNAEFYLKNLCSDARFILPKTSPNRNHTFNQFTIRVKNGLRDALKAHLQECGIESMIYYPLPIHKQKCYADIIQPDLPETERACLEVLSLPIAGHLTEAELLEVCKTINKFFATH